jgi:hypothetical protein
MANSNTLNLRIDVDAKSGEASIRTLGRALTGAGDTADKSFGRGKKSLGDFDRATAAATNTLRTLGKVGKTLTIAGLAGMTAGVYGLSRALSAATTAATVQEQAEAKLAAVVNATGQAAGFSAAEMIKMAGELQKVTTVGDETIIAGQAILATFKGIRGEAFERTTAAALDMSEVMGQDLNSTIVQLGKALNDPVANLGALGRAGVQFSDEQTELIKNLAASGQLFEAQAIILDEIESQFGGAATAVRDTYGGALTAANNAWGDLLESIGFSITKNEAMVEVIGKVEAQFAAWASEVDGGGLGDMVAEIADGALSFATAIIDNKDNIIASIEAVIVTVTAIKDAFVFVGETIGKTLAIVVGFTEDTIRLFSNVGAKVEQPILAISDYFTEALEKALKWITDFIEAAAKKFEGIIEAVKDPMGAVEGVVDGAMDAVTGTVDKAMEKAGGLWSGFAGLVEKGATGMVSFLGEGSSVKPLSEKIFELLGKFLGFADEVNTTPLESTLDATGFSRGVQDMDTEFSSFVEDFDIGINTDMVGALITGQASIEEVWGSMLDNLTKGFFDWVSNIINKGVSWLVEGITSGFSGGLTGIFDGFTGGGGGASGLVGTVAGTVGDALGLPSITEIGASIAGALGLTSAGSGLVSATAAATMTAIPAGAAGAAVPMAAFAPGWGAGGAAAAGSTGAASTGLLAGIGGVGGAALGIGAIAAMFSLGGLFGGGNERPAGFSEVATSLDAATLAAAGFDDELQRVADTSFSEMVGKILEVDEVSIDLNSNLVYLKQAGWQASAETGALIYKIDSLSGQLIETGIDTNDLMQRMVDLSAGTDLTVDAVARMVAEQAGLPGLNDELAASYLELANVTSAAAAETMRAADLSITAAAEAYRAWDRYYGQNPENGTPISEPTTPKPDGYLWPGFARGTDFVTKTGPALIHYGEAILTAEENRNRMRGGEPIVINLTNQTVLDGKVIDSRVDKHIVDRTRRNMGNRRVA